MKYKNLWPCINSNCCFKKLFSDSVSMVTRSPPGNLLQNDWKAFVSNFMKLIFVLFSIQYKLNVRSTWSQVKVKAEQSYYFKCLILVPKKANRNATCVLIQEYSASKT